MDSFIAAVCQVAAGTDPREAAVRAARAGARLVVLPAFCLEAFLGCPPAVSYGRVPTAGSSTGRAGSPPGEATPDVRTGPGREELQRLAASIAREAGCHLVAGTVLVPAGEGGARRQVAWLLSPEGELIGEQAQTHTTAEEQAAGRVEADRLEVFRALGVGIGLLVGLDVWVPEVARILTLEGATVLAAPLALPAPYSEARQIAGVWQVVQQNQVFGLEACLVGEWDGVPYAGRSAVTAPCEAVGDASGFVVRAPAADRPLTVLGGIDLEARRRAVEAYDILEAMNVRLYRQAFPMAYLGRRRRVTGGLTRRPVGGGELR